MNEQQVVGHRKHPRTDAAFKNGRYSGMEFYDFACRLEDALSVATWERNNVTVSRNRLRQQLAAAQKWYDSEYPAEDGHDQVYPWDHV